MVFFLYILYERCERGPESKNFIANSCFNVIVVHITNKKLGLFGLFETSSGDESIVQRAALTH